MLLPLTQVQSLAPNGVYGRRPGDNAAVDSLPDLLLIERSRGGEQRAIEALVRRYSRRLFRVARSVLVEEDAAESAVQDAYLAAFADRSRYTPTGTFAAWLTRLTFTPARPPVAAPRRGAELVQRLRLAQGLFELAPERLDRIVKRVLAQLPHGSMLTMSASPP